MPAYDWKCDCGKIEEVISSIDEYKQKRNCPDCGQEMYRIYNFRIGDTQYGKPLHSDSLAINPNQIEEHRKAFPDVEVDVEGRPILTSYKQHDTYLKKRGFTKETQKLKVKGKKL